MSTGIAGATVADNRSYPLSSLPDWDQAIDKWIVHLATWGRRPSTLTHYRDEGRRFSAWAEPRGRTPYSVERVHVEDHVVWIRDEPNSEGVPPGIAPPRPRWVRSQRVGAS